MTPDEIDRMRTRYNPSVSSHLPIMFIYQGDRCVAQRPMPWCKAGFPDAAAFSVDLPDLPVGDYEYEIVGGGEDNKRYQFRVVLDAYGETRIEMPRRG